MPPPPARIPEIWCPLPRRTHPDAARIDAHIITWGQRVDLIRTETAARHFRKAGFGRFAASVYPRAIRLPLASEWQLLNWVIDDTLDEGYAALPEAERETLARELMAQLTTDLSPTPPTGPLAAALGELWQRTAGAMSPAWRHRFTAHYRDWLAATLRQHQPVPRTDLVSYIRRRRLNSGCEMSFDLIEPANEYEVPADVVASDAYTLVRYAANNVVSWTNDLYSIRKEAARGDHDHLAAVLLARSPSDGWDEAMAEATAMVTAHTQDFLAASEDLRAMRHLFGLNKQAWTEVEASLDDLALWISGSLHWHQWSPRYHQVDPAPAGEIPDYLEPHLR
ncbi:Pentalenene synthase [Streptomyces sp. RB5]|uniref:Terpene synthase n=1 Tax=Streptomyces smaragdinus TaxID=2585196 RepID=A0A7K0CDQ4_9ACTN|nr:hypothetical protein [Streptomyces smaragdinus]MQY10904.1 Pentalenene synthase [Streptomyces smaragdinus]